LSERQLRARLFDGGSAQQREIGRGSASKQITRVTTQSCCLDRISTDENSKLGQAQNENASYSKAARSKTGNRCLKTK